MLGWGGAWGCGIGGKGGGIFKLLEIRIASAIAAFETA